ncbi:hypothetical protein F5X99DRAFT_427632 [Biscogniauxia marginata]|nr:hypothetical protein F5X99DRAFT_427632 [Biscogniauxia marginata]
MHTHPASASACASACACALPLTCQHSHAAETSSLKWSSTPPRASAQDGTGAERSPQPSPTSSTLSSASTVDDDGESASPILPPLPAPKLSARALNHLRTPPRSSPYTKAEEQGEEPQFVTTSWGSPYPPADSNHHRNVSFSSETSEDSPLHQLEITTPFLRPAPLILTTESEQSHSSLSGSAAVLANRARRPLRSITEDWIRQHTTHDLGSEHRHWLSDGTDESEHSSLGGSVSGDDAGWYEETDPRTPRAPSQPAKTSVPRGKRRTPRSRSSNETLRQAILNQRVTSQSEAMEVLDVGRGSQDARSIHTESGSDVTTRTDTPVTSDKPVLNGYVQGPIMVAEPPATPARPIKPTTSRTPRLKKKVPWRGKNIMVLLPRDEERGKPGKAPVPIDAASVDSMLRSWEELGYNIRGFDLDGPLDNVPECSQSRGAWPDPDDVQKERTQRHFQVTLPDLDAWKNYANELQEAKLRALGVSFADEEPAPPPSISPAVSNMSRQASNQFPLPFSPPLPASSAASNGLQGFPFSGPFLSNNGSSATQSPGIPSITSPVSFNAPHGHGKFNPRASISISPHELPFHLSGQPSPHGWSPQLLLQQQLARGGSPSVLNLNSLTSPTSPFQRDGMSPPMNIHQRHQSLQYPMLPQHLQRQDSARASPRLQELREVDEETQSNPYEGKSPSKTPEPTHFIRHNASDSLQKEIDDAEYHLEEQFRSQLEHEDYSPHNENEKVEANNSFNGTTDPSHARGPSVHFGGFGTDSDEGPKLHHPQPHSRGHSLSQQPYFDNDEVRDSTDEGSVNKPRPNAINLHKSDNSYEIETNPSNLGTPVEPFEFVNQLHDRSFSNTSNPWADVQSMSRRPSHSSKSSLTKLNAAAAEFKFNPTSNFTPGQLAGQFIFGNNNPQPSPFQPSVFQQASVTSYPQSAVSSHFSVPSNSSNKVNATAPVFSPGRSDFSFSSSGPKFNPDAKAFQPLTSFASSVGSAPASGNESVENRPSSIFSNIDLTVSEIVKPVKKSKAIPIVRPSSTAGSLAETASAQGDDRSRDRSVADTNRATKKFRDNNDDNNDKNGDSNDVPQFAEPTPELETKGDEDETAHMDTTFASTILSESTDGKLQSESNGTKATTSPSATSPDHEKATWKPFEFKSETEMLDFNNARPFGEAEPDFKKEHKRSLSATAKPFVPTGFLFGAENPVDTPFNPVLKPEPPQMTESAKGSDDDRAGSPTPGPDTLVRVEPEAEAVSQPEAASAPSTGGLGSSRFASPSPAPKGLKSSRFASTPSPLPKVPGLGASRYAASPSPVSEDNGTEPASTNGVAPAGETQLHSFEPLPVSPPSDTDEPRKANSTEDLTFEEIDEVMEHLNKNDPTQGVKRLVESPKWHHPSPVQNISVAAITQSPPQEAQEAIRGKAPSPSPRPYRTLHPDLAIPRASTEIDDPFIDRPRDGRSPSYEPPVRRLNVGESLPESEWDDAFSASEQDKLEQRVRYFDSHVNDVVGNLLDSRLDPLEKTLDTIHHVLGSLARRAPSSRRDRSSISAEVPESDADDEDEETPVRRSMSPKRDKKLEQIRIAVIDALNQQQATRTLQPAQLELVEEESKDPKEASVILKMLEEMKEQLGKNLQVDLRPEELRSIVEEAVVRGVPPSLPPVARDDEEVTKVLSEMQARVIQLEDRLHAEEDRAERERSRVLDLETKLRAEETRSGNEIATRRAAEDRAAELRRQLEQAETKVEVEIMNRSVFDQRTHDLEERLKAQERKTEMEFSGRREAEDRLSEIQRLLRISSEEEDRLRSVLEDREQKIRAFEQASAKSSMRISLLDAAQSSAEQTQADLKNRLAIVETEVNDARQEARHWRSEAEHARDSAHQQTDDFVQAVNENKHLHKLIDTLGVQLEENERIRDSWRAKFVSLQDNMAHAAREITEENSRRTKKEQALIARQEVLDARLQAEARTRERLEVEVERLENGERAGMRAVSECKRLEGLLSELRNENHNLEQNVLRYQREIKEARESAATEVKRTRVSLDAELEAANNQVNSVRNELEEEITKLRAQLDQIRLDADTAKAHHEMMLEESQFTKQTELQEAQRAKESELEELVRKHQNEVEDLQARYERQISNAIEDAQRSEQNLLERLSLSTSKTEHLQDRVAHLEDKVQIAQEAARAAAQAAAQASKGSLIIPEQSTQSGPVAQTKQLAQAMQLPEKISPQALRESIMVLQEQLQAREQRIEELEQTVTKLDPDATTKIAKRDDEITWLRELLAVRHGDLQDIIGALSADKYDKEAVKDAAIRLKANLQMEEQERERAVNGGSSISLPSIAASLRGVATPRVAQAVGPLAAAWGSWRKGNQQPSLKVPRVSSSPAPARHATPSKTSPAISQSSFLSGLMTPPASGVRNISLEEQGESQPTAFGNTGRRFTAEQFANRSRSHMTARQAEKMPIGSTPPLRQDQRNPVTPPMMRSNSYDADARVEDFDDASFFDD